MFDSASALLILESSDYLTVVIYYFSEVTSANELLLNKTADRD